MDSKTRTGAINRLKSAAGHLQGVVTMLEEDRYCVDVIRQIQAVQAALDKASQVILDNHLHTCVTRAIQAQDPDQRERVLSEVMDVYRSRRR